MKAVMILLQKPKDWESVLQEMRKPNLLIKQLQNIDKKNIPEEVIQELDKYTNEIDPDLETIKFKSLTAYHLWIWVHSVENYHEIYRDIKPWNQKLLRTKTSSVSLLEDNEKAQQTLLERQKLFVTEREEFIKASMQVNMLRIVVE